MLGSKNRKHPKDIPKFFFYRRKHPKGEATQPKKIISQQISCILGPSCTHAIETGPMAHKAQ
jgi:hypothetical protein